MDLLLGNTRTREERRGDFTAQISANLIGIEKLQSAYAKYGDVLLDCMEEIQNYADRMMRSTIRKILTTCMSSRISWTAAASWCPTPSISG